MNAYRLAALALAGAMALNSPAGAQSAAGEAEFMQSCASCHGVDARGTGPLADFLSVDVPDLTGISARNDGVFPMLEVIHTIDGRMEHTGHGFPMPVWGQRYEHEAAANENPGPYGAEILVRGRILALAEYLMSLQQ